MNYKSKIKTCGVEDCVEYVKCKNLCEVHYWRIRTHGTFELLGVVRNKGTVCAIDGCRKASRKTGLCNSHYTELWRTKNPELAHKNMQQSWRNRSVRKKRISTHHSRNEWEVLLTWFGGLCAYCDIQAANTRDHIIPLADDGVDTIDNILPACTSCNCSKSDNSLYEWLEKKGYQGVIERINRWTVFLQKNPVHN